MCHRFRKHFTCNLTVGSTNHFFVLNSDCREHGLRCCLINKPFRNYPSVVFIFLFHIPSRFAIAALCILLAVHSATQILQDFNEKNVSLLSFWLKHLSIWVWSGIVAEVSNGLFKGPHGMPEVHRHTWILTYSLLPEQCREGECCFVYWLYFPRSIHTYQDWKEEQGPVMRHN